jgi:hypothetical protein
VRCAELIIIIRRAAIPYHIILYGYKSSVDPDHAAARFVARHLQGCAIIIIAVGAAAAAARVSERAPHACRER